MRGRSIEAIEDMYHKTGRIFLGVNFFASKLRAEPEAEGGAMRCLEWCALCSPSRVYRRYLAILLAAVKKGRQAQLIYL